MSEEYVAPPKPPLSNPMAEALAEDAAKEAARAAAQTPTPAPVVDPTPEPEPEPVEASEGTEQPAEPITPKEPKSPVKQLQGRVGFLTKQLHEKTARETELASQVEAMRALLEAQGVPEGSTPSIPAAPSVNGSRPLTQADVMAQAEAIADAKAFNATAETIYNSGKEKFGDWQDSVDNLNAVGLMTRPLIEAAAETGAAAEVIRHLGQDLDEASRIASLPPVRMAVEVAKLAGKLITPKTRAISNAPAPVSPVKGSAAAPAADLRKIADADDMTAWVAARKAAGDRWAR